MKSWIFILVVFVVEYEGVTVKEKIGLIQAKMDQANAKTSISCLNFGKKAHVLSQFFVCW